MKRPKETSLIAVDKFIQATRDSGYKGTPSAVAELVDNSLQAGATEVDIVFNSREEREDYPLDVYLLDNGEGMTPEVLRQALRFGGSSRFGDRAGLGRYGMGLPNSSLSQARRLEVYSWRDGEEPWFSYLDVDEIAAGGVTDVPEPVQRALPDDVPAAHPHGTLIIWTKCDRLDNKRASTNARKLASALGRVFRRFIWAGVSLRIDGEPVAPLDPLFLSGCEAHLGEDEAGEEWASATADIFGEPIVYEVQAPPTSPHPHKTGLVTVTFTELPVHAWHGLSNKTKRRLGISKGAGVSIIRGDREVDYGWHFLRGKRRENYDDWWRCEVRFDPVLDEAFGITHTKQQVRPMEYLSALLSEDMETLARALNARVRRAHLQLKTAERFSKVEQLVQKKDELLKPIQAAPSREDAAALAALRDKHPSLAKDTTRPYRLIEDASAEAPRAFFDLARDEDQLVVSINPEHPFYKKIYKPLLEEKTVSAATVRGQLELLLLSAARSVAEVSGEDEREALAEWRARWGETIATFLNG